jgi:ubiquinone/menaquinone biosynthesis C-methylase UbiE
MANGSLKNKYFKGNHNYQDFVIRDGKFIGEFEEMYNRCTDPWGYKVIGSDNIDHKTILEFCDYVLKKKIKKIKVLEMGCGLGILSNQLAKKGFKTFAFDISKTAIYKASKKYKNKNLNFFVSDFDNYVKFKKIKPDIYILSDISWYVLPKLKKFISFFKKKSNPAYLIHCLAIPKIQKYGKNYFQSEKTILNFFNLNIIATANLKYFEEDKKKPLENHTCFLAKN